MKLADPNPAYCSCCFQQKPDQKHIDCEAYFDGPVIDNASGIKQAIDDLILCADCGKEIGTFFGMVENDKAQKDVKRLRDENEALKAELAELKPKLEGIAALV